MKLFQRLTLTRQLVLLVAMALLVAQGVNFGLLLSEQRGAAIARSVEPAVAMLQLEERSAFRRPPPRRVGFLRQTPAPMVRPDMERADGIERRIFERLTENGRPPLGVRAAVVRRNESSPRPQLLVSASFDEGIWRNIRVPAPPGITRAATALFAQTLIIFVMILAPLIWFARRASNSLTALDDAAQSFRGTGKPHPVPLSGPADIRSLTSAFNAMQARIAAMLSEKDQMLGAIGHDLRTPLAALRIRAESVEDGNEREAMIASIEELHSSLEDILTLARLGREASGAVDTDVAALIEDIVREEQEIGHAVTISNIEPATRKLHPTSLRRAIRNLIDNALKYGGSAEISLNTGEGGTAIRVSDRGPGINEPDLKRAAEPFVRLESSRNRETGGSGLGLAIARAAAQLHGGKLLLKNRTGGGLTAEIHLPS